MANETTVKIQLEIPLDKFIERINKHGFSRTETLNQHDIYFDTSDWHFYNHLASFRLRLIDGADHSLTFKKVFYSPKGKQNFITEEITIDTPFKDFKAINKLFDRLELESPEESLINGRTLQKHLLQLGLQSEQQVHKVRQVYVSPDAELVIDMVDNVGILIELRNTTIDTSELIQNILEEKEWSPTAMATSFIWLKNVKEFDHHETAFEKFTEDPQWNVWEHEQKIYKKLIKSA